MADLVTFGEAMLRYSPPAGTRLETTDTLEVGIAGAESNVAVAAARTGTPACWISKLPSGPLGRRVTNFLRGVGLETAVVWEDAGRQGTYYVETGEHPRGTEVLYDRGDTPIRTATVEELPTELIADAEIFATTGITPALSETLAETTSELLAHAQSHGTTTVFDMNYRSKLWTPSAARSCIEDLVPHLDIFVIGEADAATVFGVDGTASDLAEELFERWEVETLVLTRGASGAIGVTSETVVEQPVIETQTVDPIGTGDAFVGGFITRYLEGASLDVALRFATATAALKRTIKGDVAVLTREEVDRVVGETTDEIRR